MGKNKLEEIIDLSTIAILFEDAYGDEGLRAVEACDELVEQFNEAIAELATVKRGNSKLAEKERENKELKETIENLMKEIVEMKAMIDSPAKTGNEIAPAGLD